ncbi:uncharacterized protein LOC125045663 [Penaeus chinensis]|uniref:uncharacterized protein LOC125045663 n=1 Tax=Penaeus chinensis TaxID=139456 RepID=UPI001FB7424C|nr:uncharacterized protein LOC125045663 [Penaeus chinensis]
MGTPRHSINSSRLSMDIADLPLTPFGMSPHASSRRRRIFASQKSNKLSLKTAKSPDKKQHSATCAEKENQVTGDVHRNRNVRLPGNYNRYNQVSLETVNEKSLTQQTDSEGDDDILYDDSENTVNFQVLHTSTLHSPNQGSKALLREPVRKGDNSNVTVRRRNRKEESKEPSIRRDSIFTDIDDGSFVEYFCGKENGYVAPKVEKIPRLYYTCQSQNETQFSTSTKVNSAPVGFRKFVEKVRTHRPLINIVEEDVETCSPNEKNNHFLCDESIITGSADIMRSTKKKTNNKALNSTTVGWPANQVRESLMPGLSDVSSLTLRTDRILGSDSTNSTPCTSPRFVQNKKTETVKTIVISESSEEEEEDIHIEHRVTKHRGNYVNVINAQTNQVQKEPDIVSSQEEFHSFISEDVSIVSSVLPVRKYQQPVTIVKASPKVLRYEYKEPSRNLETTSNSDNISESDDDEIQVPVLPQRQYRKYSDEGNQRDSEGSRVGSPGKPKAIIPDIASPTVAGWIISSPFKDSSFGTSFLKQRSDPDVGRSVSQKVVEASMSDDSGSCEISQRLNLLHEVGSPRALVRRKISSVSRNESSSGPVQKENCNSDSEDSDNIFQRRSKASARVICTESEESSDEREIDRSKEDSHMSHSENHVFLKSKSQKDNELSAGESFHLRLSEELSKTNRISEKSVHTVGKDATSPKVFRSPVVQSDNEDSINLYQRKDRNVKNIIISDSESSNSDGIYEGDEDEHPSFVSLPDLEDNKRTEQNLHADILPQSPVRSNVSDKSNSAESVSPKATRHTKTTSSLLNLKTVQDELDKLYSSEWRKNENAFLGSIKKKTRQHCKDDERINASLTEDESPIQRKTKKAHAVIVTSDESEEEDSLLYQVEESSGEEEEEQESDEVSNSIDNVSYESPKNGRQKVEESHVPSSPDLGDSNGDDSFEEYLKNVKKQIAKDKKVIHTHEDQDTYEDSFINDDDECEDDVSFYLPSLLERTNKKVNGGYSVDVQSRGSISEELKSKRKISQESKVEGKADDPKGSVRSTKKKVTIKSSTSSSWRDSPTITLSSDSESDEVFSLDEVKRPVPTLYPLVTPKNRGRGRPKALPKTEGHNRQVSKVREMNNGLNSTPTLSFLASLSKHVNLERCHPEALLYTKNFKKSKEQLAEKLYTFYNTLAFENKLPATMSIKWNARMTKTAGFCYYQIDRSKPNGRGARIELSTKVIDAAERLRDTLIHELCHAAAWIISGYKDGHGPLWKAWAAKARMAFPELPAISRCHSYEIACKYTYRCIRCSYSIGRHSKSLDTDRKVCGYCYGKFELVVNSQAGRGRGRSQGSESGVGGGTPSQAPPKTPRTPGAFALFVKENYGSIKKSRDNLKHADVMKILSTEFAKLKTSGK